MAGATFQTILQHINLVLPSLWQLVTAATFLAGFAFAVIALFQFRSAAEARTQQSPTRNYQKPIISLIIAVVLLYWPTVYHAAMETVFRTASPISYSPSSASTYNDVIKLSGNIIQFIGFIAFIRGWILLGRIGQQNAREGAFGKALAHIIGGIFAINIFATWEILQKTLGL